jgi:uncharacterized protein (DUF305 family)
MGKYGLFFLGLLLGWWLAPQADTRAPLSPESAVENRIDIDIGYAQSMLVHHQQALIMASLMQGDQQSAVQGLASRIVREQSMEMESLKGWLAGQRAASLPASGDLMGWMKNNSQLLNVNEALYLERCERSPFGMAGLVESSSIKKLGDGSMTLKEREASFLKLMIEHHQGAVSMSTLPSRAAGTPFIRNLAQHVLQRQTQELAQMMAMLEQ